MNHQHQPVTFTCFGTRPLFCALSPFHLSALTGDSRKHPPNVPMRPNHAGGNLTLYCSPDTARALQPHQTPIQNP